jgi:hypothetical protein
MFCYAPRWPVDRSRKAPLGCFSHNAQSGGVMIDRTVLPAFLLLMPCLLAPASAVAQDVPGIEICTVEKTMERRTSCLQSNVDFLIKTITKLGADHQQKIDAAKAQVEGLKNTVVGLQKAIEELQAAQKKMVEDQKKKPEQPAAKDGASRDSPK